MGKLTDNANGAANRDLDTDEPSSFLDIFYAYKPFLTNTNGTKTYAEILSDYSDKEITFIVGDVVAFAQYALPSLSYTVRNKVAGRINEGKYLDPHEIVTVSPEEFKETCDFATDQMNEHGRYRLGSSEVLKTMMKRIGFFNTNNEQWELSAARVGLLDKCVAASDRADISALYSQHPMTRAVQYQDNLVYFLDAVAVSPGSRFEPIPKSGIDHLFDEVYERYVQQFLQNKIDNAPSIINEKYKKHGGISFGL